MSDTYIRRMRGIRDEFDIASDVFRVIREKWHRQEIADALRPRTLPHIQKTEAGLERTYFVRLTAEFEGVLKDHLRTNHKSVSFPANKRDWTLDWFLSQVTRGEKLTLDPDLRQKLDEVRDYRNALAHGSAAVFPITFAQALARYNIFLDKLPDPKT